MDLLCTRHDSEQTVAEEGDGDLLQAWPSGTRDLTLSTGLKEKQQDQRLTVEKMLLGNSTEVEPSRQIQGGDAWTRPANNASIVN